MGQRFVWRINRFYGGLSTGSKVGVEGSFLYGQGLDFRTDPDLLQANYAMTKDSSTNVTDLIKWFAQNGTTIYAYGDSGKLYSNASSWTSIRSVGSSVGQGLTVYNGYLYYALTAALGRFDLASTYDDAYQSLTSDALWHPCTVFLDKLCVGNGRTLATLDSSNVWTSNTITLPVGWKIKSLEVTDNHLWIGAWKGTAITDYEQGALFAWGGESGTYDSVEFINESGVNALKNFNNSLYVFAGTRGNIYQFVNGSYVKIKRIPSIGTGKYADVFPGAVTGWNGILHFGAAGITDSSTLNQGVYTWGQAEKNYPHVLNFDYPISTATTTGTGMKIGAVHGASPSALYVGWKDASTYGIDKISTSTQQSTIILETLIHDARNPSARKVYKAIRLMFKPFTASESVVVKVKADRAAAWTTLTDATEPLENTSYKRLPLNTSTGYVKSRDLQVRLELTDGAQLIEASVEGETVDEE